MNENNASTQNELANQLNSQLIVHCAAFFETDSINKMFHFRCCCCFFQFTIVRSGTTVQHFIYDEFSSFELTFGVIWLSETKFAWAFARVPLCGVAVKVKKNSRWKFGVFFSLNSCTAALITRQHNGQNSMQTSSLVRFLATFSTTGSHIVQYRKPYWWALQPLLPTIFTPWEFSISRLMVWTYVS